VWHHWSSIALGLVLIHLPLAFDCGDFDRSQLYREAQMFLDE